MIPQQENFHLGLLYLIKLLIDADGIVNDKEQEALEFIYQELRIPERTFQQFELAVSKLTEREVYEQGVRKIKACAREEKLKAFSILFKLSEVDGKVHEKEIKLLLYAIKTAGVEFDDVVDYVKQFPFSFARK